MASFDYFNFNKKTNIEKIRNQCRIKKRSTSIASSKADELLFQKHLYSSLSSTKKISPELNYINFPTSNPSKRHDCISAEKAQFPVTEQTMSPISLDDIIYSIIMRGLTWCLLFAIQLESIILFHWRQPCISLLIWAISCALVYWFNNYDRLQRKIGAQMLREA
ncbi:11636_t:CDS:1 [Ambispora leptoticha]|uniref:11636_t:CDS:1 n=1 Tax=Ambispora leptoticha TaxID=144679 RepID=A0A9N9GGQ8_9GLOM|nr:11636_t:CDS:1 [Ambispora leptoticha]